MARKSRHRISYVLPLPNPTCGHRRGVNALTLDRERSLLYSGGQDGLIGVWALKETDSQPKESIPHTRGSARQLNIDGNSPAPGGTTCQAQVQAHTHWVNDVALTWDKAAVVSASSDLTIKVWRPFAEDQALPQTIGVHRDYVKCLAAPNAHADWIASGGLDRQICLWDLNGGGQSLRIDVAEEHDKVDKGSIYALGVGGSILASGGPESIVRVWDARSGKRVTKFVGHTDNIRDILISEHGDIVMSASSDQTIKIWSLNAGRCMHTLTMHNESVWSLDSTHPRLSVFYSGDRSGLVAKTTVPANASMDEGLCVALCQEHGAVSKVVGDGSNVWTATSSSTINRWADADLAASAKMAAEPRSYRSSSVTHRARVPISPRSATMTSESGGSRRQVSQKNVLRLSAMAPFTVAQHHTADPPLPQSISILRQGSVTGSEAEAEDVTPLRHHPEESLEGQRGLVKHMLLNDRRRVLTVNSVGEVALWDLIRCELLKSYGRVQLEEVAATVNTTESIQNWCSVDTRTGRLTCVLEENYCFDGEMYADELPNPEGIEFRDDQRVNLGKWVLRYLFSGLIDEEIRRDELFRNGLQSAQVPLQVRTQRKQPPSSIQLPSSPFVDWPSSPLSTPGPTPRAANGYYGPITPGMTIGAATPAPQPRPVSQTTQQPLPSEDGTPLEKKSSQHSLPRPSSGTPKDYFSSVSDAQPSSSREIVKTSSKAGSTHEERPTQANAEPEKENLGRELSSRLGKKFRMPFGGKKLGRTATNESGKTVPAEDKTDDSDEDKSAAGSVELVIEDNLFGVVQKIRQAYKVQLQDQPGPLPPARIHPSLPVETPVLKLPPSTDIIIQEDRPDTGGVVDVYWGTVATVGADADLVEKAAPMWLGELLLLNQMPFREIAKIPFILEPYEKQLPSIASENGNTRLNANRMLRAKKILTYVAERLPSEPDQPDQRSMRPEEYLELYCQDQIVPLHMTLGALRAHVWKAGGDVMLFYRAKSNTN